MYNNITKLPFGKYYILKVKRTYPFRLFLQQVDTCEYYTVKITSKDINMYTKQYVYNRIINVYLETTEFNDKNSQDYFILNNITDNQNKHISLIVIHSNIISEWQENKKLSEDFYHDKAVKSFLRKNNLAPLNLIYILFNPPLTWKRSRSI